MKGAIRNSIIAILGVVVLGISLYGCVALYYWGGFAYGTVINGTDLTGMSIEEANSILVAKAPYKEINVIDKTGQSYIIPMETIGYHTDYTNALTEYQKNHPHITWGRNFINKTEETITPQVTFDSGLLEMQLESAPFMAQSTLYGEDNTIEIILTDNDGYQIMDSTKDMLHPDLVLSAVSDAIYQKAESINLMEMGCYESVENPELENKVNTLYEKISDFQSFRLTYVMGNTEEVVDSTITSTWIALDENGNFLTDENGNLILDENAVKEYVASLADKYDTKDHERTFTSTSGKEIHFSQNQVLYGTTLDQTAEVKALIEDLKSGENDIRREPKYISKAFAQGEDDVGNTYIEINLTEQHLYYYKNGEVFLESDFVSGNMARGTSTPQLFAYVRNKATNVTLRGVDYESFVYYWMGIWRGYGMHDATWRAKFGGNIYKTNGSHGCVNLPLNFIKQFYPEVEVGTPLIMFYEPESTPEETAAAEKARDEARARADAAEAARAAQKAAAEEARKKAEEQAALEAYLRQQQEAAQNNYSDDGGNNDSQPEQQPEPTPEQNQNTDQQSNEPAPAPEDTPAPEPTPEPTPETTPEATPTE